MSAAKWRRAMSAPIVLGGGTTALASRVAAPPLPRPNDTPWLGELLRAHVRPRHLIVLAALLVYPWIASPFFTFQIGGQTLALGVIALSLTLLGGYGGMISLAQMTVAGIAGYMVAIFGVSG